MRDYLSLGTTPWEEDCAQVGEENYIEKARKECARFIEGLEHYFGGPPYGVTFKATANPHDFGTYYDVVVWYDINDEEAVKYAFDVEGNIPRTWEELENETYEMRRVV